MPDTPATLASPVPDPATPSPPVAPPAAPAAPAARFPDSAAPIPAPAPANARDSAAAFAARTQNPRDLAAYLRLRRNPHPA